MLRIKSIKKLIGKFKVHDIEVKDSHHYILENGVITHNSGGYGLKFAASSIVFLTKSKVKDEDKRVVGGNITCRMVKSRFTKEFSSGQVGLSFVTGLNRYSGLLELGLEGGVITREKNTYYLPNGEGVSKAELEENPEKYYTQDVLEALDKAAHSMFYYGSDDPDSITAGVTDEQNEEETDEKE